jgi:hypothetical protein
VALDVIANLTKTYNTVIIIDNLLVLDVLLWNFWTYFKNLKEFKRIASMHEIIVSFNASTHF